MMELVVTGNYTFLLCLSSANSCFRYHGVYVHHTTRPHAWHLCPQTGTRLSISYHRGERRSI